MISLVITANENPVTVQDPSQASSTPETQAVINVPANTTKTVEMPWERLERIRPQLDNLADKEWCTFTVTSTANPKYADQSDNPGNPVIDYADVGVITAASLVLTVTGSHLLAEGEKSKAELTADTDAGSIDLKATLPSNNGNLYDIEVIDSTAGGLTVAVNPVPATGRTLITVDLGGSAAETCTTVAAIINNAASATYGLIQATVVGTGATPITGVQEVTPFTGGKGTGVSVTLAGLPCVISDFDITGAPVGVITLDTPVLTPLGLSTGAPLNLELRSNNKMSNITLTHA